jgi:hypothetical protein
MTTKHFFNLKSSGVVMIFCALCLFVILGRTETKSNDKSESINNNDSFQQQLLERSQEYLDSIRQHSADLSLSPKVRAKLKLQAQNVVNKGLAKLSCPAELVQKRTTPADLNILSDAVQKIGKTAAFKVAEFLSDEFCCVTELEVAVRVALPSWNYWQHCRLTANNFGALLGLFGSDYFNNTAVIVPVFPRDHKTLAKILGQSVVVFIIDLEIDIKSVFHRILNDDLLSGFTLIAQTVIQRK